MIEYFLMNICVGYNVEPFRLSHRLASHKQIADNLLKTAKTR